MSTLKKTRPDTAYVIGGGPAGMMAALFLARAGAQVVLLERNEKLGKKLYITGKGRCNLTNTADMDELLAQIPHGARFLQSSLRAFDAQALCDLMADLGVPTKVERGGRVFPESEKASDVTRGLERALREAGVSVRLNARVSALIQDEQGISGIRLMSGEELPCRAVILATGGASYPATGSTGDGYSLAQQAGHTVHPARPSLVPLITRDAWPLQLQGLALKNVVLSATMGGKKRYSELGEMLFTHFGVSGPLVLELSSHILDDDLNKLDVRIDLKPGLTLEQLEARVLRDFADMSRKQLAHALEKLLPQRLAALFPQLCGIAPEKVINQISREERRRLLETLKALPLPIAGFRPLEEAIITRGGVELSEVVPGTMASKKLPGLFFAGELLDADAHTGGFNLQIAFSTGVASGKAAAAWVDKLST